MLRSVWVGACVAGLLMGSAAIAAGHGGGHGGGFARGGPRIAYGGSGGRYGGYGYTGAGRLGYGLYFAALPFAYSTIWWDDEPFYYANDNYYQWDVATGEYETVQAPPDDAAARGADRNPDTLPASIYAGNDPASMTNALNAANGFFTYPKNGQSADQQAKDQYECHRWAASQSGFDPTRAAAPVADTDTGAPPPPPVPSPQAAAYRRAQIACLQGRGYNLK